MERTLGQLPEHPDPDLIFRQRVGVRQAARELWKAREIVRSLAERTLRVRYKQATLGVAWAVLTPLALMLVFAFFVARVVSVEHGNAPYPIFAYLGLLPWTFFSTSVSDGGMSLVNNTSLLNKIYCPREVFPLASVVVAAVNTAIASAVLAGLFLFYRFAPAVTSVWVPVLTVILLAFTIGAGLLVSITVVYFRDLRHALPILLQLGLFATPVAYGLEVVPQRLLPLYSLLNPLAPVIDGFRQTVLYGNPPQVDFLLPGVVGAVLTLGLGLWAFKRFEPGIADVA